MPDGKQRAVYNRDYAPPIDRGTARFGQDKRESTQNDDRQPRRERVGPVKLFFQTVHARNEVSGRGSLDVDLRCSDLPCVVR